MPKFQDPMAKADGETAETAKSTKREEITAKTAKCAKGSVNHG